MKGEGIINNVEFFLKEQQITKKILVIQNISMEEKLFKIMLNHDLYKLVYLKEQEIKKISIDETEINSLDVLEVLEEDGGKKLHNPI